MNLTDQRPIQFLTLYFPHGATVGECDYIAKRVEHVVGARVSAGGMAPKNGFEDFSDDSMMYEYGHAKVRALEKLEQSAGEGGASDNGK